MYNFGGTNKMNLLYVAYRAPYTTVDHAGGQTLNYYIKSISNEADVDVTLVTYVDLKEKIKIENEKDNIRKELIVRKPGIGRFLGRVTSIWSKFYPKHRYANMVTSYSNRMLFRKLKSMKRKGYHPDIIVLEWTQMVLLIDDIKKIFPSSKYIASEHDVTFLGKYRMMEYEKNRLKRNWKKIIADNTKQRELTALNKCNVVYTHNKKDKKLLTDNGMNEKKIKVEVPFYHVSELNYKRNNNDILFFGCMSRIENELSAVWFIENVLSRLKDLDCRFVIIGGGASANLKSYESEKVHIEGFVEKIDSLFSEAMCFVAPIQLGAGIKVKVLEAMCTNIPVLTNNIGIEGIPAEDGIHFIHCETGEEYEKNIREIYNNKSKCLDGRLFVMNEFSLSQSYKHYYESIKELGESV